MSASFRVICNTDIEVINVDEAVEREKRSKNGKIFIHPLVVEGFRRFSH